MKKGQKRKISRYFGKLFHKTLNKKHETIYLKYATMNIKYEYFCYSEHKMSNMKHKPITMKLEHKHEMGAEKKNFRVFGKLFHEILNKKYEIYYLKYATMNIKYEYFYNSEHKI